MIRGRRTERDRIAEVALGVGVAVEPPSARPAVEAALRAVLEGAPADLPAGALAARIRAAVPVYANLPDMSPDQLAAALRDQLGGADNPGRIGELTVDEWRSLTAPWRGAGWALYGEEPGAAADHLALDEVLTDRVGRGEAGPSLRFWGWNERAVILGRSQVAASEVDLAEVRAGGWAVARRVSGGGAMLAEPGGTITYSLVMPESFLIGMSIRRSYEVCDAFAVLALRSLGVAAWYVPVNDIGTGRGKLAGAAQARRRGAVLHHTTMAYRLDPAAVSRVLRLGGDRAATRGTVSAPKVVLSLAQVAPESREDAIQALSGEFAATFGAVAGDLDGGVRAEAAGLAERKYRSAEWIGVP